MRLHRHFSYANVMSTLAVFLALAGGSVAISAIGRDEIGSRQVDNNTLKSVDLKNNRGVKGRDVVEGSLSGADVRDGSLAGADVGDGSLGGADVSDGSLTGADVAEASIGGGDVSDDALTGADVLESSLGQVPSAANADTVDGKSASELQTSSAFVQRDGNFDLTSSYQDILSTTIATAGTRVIAVGSVEVEGDGGGNDSAACLLEIAGVEDTNDYEEKTTDAGSDDANIAAVFAREVGPGTHSVALRCKEAPASAVNTEDAALSVWAVGS